MPMFVHRALGLGMAGRKVLTQSSSCLSRVGQGRFRRLCVCARVVERVAAHA